MYCRWVSLRLDNIGNAIIFSAAMFGVWERGSINAGIIGLSVSYALQVRKIETARKLKLMVDKVIE